MFWLDVKNRGLFGMHSQLAATMLCRATFSRPRSQGSTFKEHTEP